MGYYSGLSILYYNPKVNIEKIKELEKSLQNQVEGITGFECVKFKIGKNGVLEDIELEEYYQKFYETDRLAKKLAECIEEGFLELIFDGEDNYKWGYRISKNKVEELIWEKMTETEKKELEELKKFKPYLDVLSALKNLNRDKVLVKTENGSGPYYLKLKKGTKVHEVKYALKYLFNDLAHDLGIHNKNEDYNVIY